MNHLVSLPKTLTIVVVIFTFCFIYLSFHHPHYSVSSVIFSLPTDVSSRETSFTDSPTNLSHPYLAWSAQKKRGVTEVHTSRYDHRKYYYFGGESEFVLSNNWYSFSQGFGGAGFILSYPLAKVLAEDMENCLLRYRYTLKPAADLITMSCIADIGVSFTLRIAPGYLSSHPQFPLLSMHHLDFVDPLFPSVNRYESTRHLMGAATADQTRMLQQTICYHRENRWSLSISWGYSAHIYERIMPRGLLQFPIETFRPWGRISRPPNYMFNTRRPSDHLCETPHVFFFQTVDKKTEHDPVIATFTRAWPQVLTACPGNNSAEFVSKILVFTPPTKRFEIDRNECCDIVRIQITRQRLNIGSE